MVMHILDWLVRILGLDAPVVATGAPPRSSQWQTVRRRFLNANPTCAACGQSDGLEVHHVVPFHVDRSLELEPSNLITLCGSDCHYLFGHLKDWTSWNKNVRTDCQVFLIQVRNRPKINASLARAGES